MARRNRALIHRCHIKGGLHLVAIFGIGTIKVFAGESQKSLARGGIGGISCETLTFFRLLSCERAHDLPARRT